MILSLPTTLVELRRQIVDDEVSIAQALATQRSLLDLDPTHWHSIVDTLDESSVEPVHSGSLTGVGLAHKDIFIIDSHRPHCGAKADHLSLPTAPSSPLFQRLKQCGASVLATLTMAEYASGVTGENPGTPLPQNPLFPGAMVGGSSSGSAVAVAAGLCYASLGTDTAGSVRIPAASCGILGLKPTRGLLSTEGCYPLAPTLDTVGILARSARDAAQVLAATLTESERHAYLPGFRLTDSSLQSSRWHEILSQDLELPALTRIAYCVTHNSPHVQLHDDQRQVIEHYLNELSESVSSVAPAKLDGMSEWVRLANVVMHVEAATTHFKALQSGAGINHITRATALPGTVIPAPWYASALRHAPTHQAKFLETHLQNHDILLTPVFPEGVPDWEDVITDSERFKPQMLLGLFSWTSFVNYLGLPAVVFPIGRDARNRPVSIQAIGRPHSEQVLLALAHQHERQHYGEAGFVTAPPALCHNLISRDQQHA
ncbi:amidase [Pusillimonas sp. ANT_WB101]|uniref:amidase n=1 Tax=Pusillimonas sp. ANT_WB101 TaxID=2597356 RepID=UPI00165E555A|nr:amidase [Pusillimonas sp. ANT_WB101]